jgi:hypothetical protein
MLVDPAVAASSGTPQDGGTPLGAGGAAGDPAAAAQAQQTQPASGQGQAQQPQGQNIVIPSAAMKRIKDEERQKGRMEALDSLAKEAGFASNLELVSALAALRGGGTPQPSQAQPPQPSPQQPPPQQAQSATPPAAQPHPDPLAQTNDQRAAAKYERQLEKLTRERDRYVQEAQAAAAESTRLQQALDAKTAEDVLKETARGVGVKDTDYALRLFYREVEGKSEEELTKLDERAFFTSLRQTRPYLFGEAVVPATTGTGTGTAPGSPKPGAVSSQQARNGQFDARNAKPEDVAARLRQLGLNQHL